MAKISLKKDYMDGNILYGKDLNPNFETIETTINDNDDAQAGTNAEVEEALTQLSSDMSQAKTDISGLQEDVADLETAALDIPTKTSELENDSGFLTNADIPTKISQLENDDNTVKDADYVHTDNNYTDEDKTKLSNMSEYELPVATSSTLGGVMIGQGLNIGSNGSISLGTASASQLGGVKAGDGVEIESDGTLNVTGGGGSTGDGIPTLVGTQENPIKLYSINSGSISDGVPVGLCIISGYTKELDTSEATDKFNGKLCYTSSNWNQFIGPDYNGNVSDSDTFLNLVFWFRPGVIQSGTSYFSRPLIEFTYNDIITNTKQGYVTPKAVYDYVGALASLNTTDKTSIVNAINELVNSTGTPGEDGLDYLGYYSSTSFMQEPYIGQTFKHQISNFSRTPVVGDAYIMLGHMSYGNHSYLITCEVTGVSETLGTVYSKIVTFVETTGEQGSNGAKGDTGPQGPAGPAGADGITPTIGENGNWYLGETDTGKPSRGGQGPKGDTGEQGPQGLPGPAGPGLPTGGTTGQVLSKNSDSDYDTVWKDIESGGEGIPELIGTQEDPVLLYNIVETGVYKIVGSYKSTETGATTNNEGGSLILYVDKDAEGNIAQRFWGTNAAFVMQTRIALAFAGGAEALKTKSFKRYELSNNLQMDGVGKFVDALTLRNSIGYNNKNSLQTTDKSSLVAAINELNTRLAALENPTE